MSESGAAEIPESAKVLPFIPKNIGEALETARILLTAKAIPESLTKDRGRDLPKDEIVSKVVSVIMAGAEVGMGPMGAVANIALINQRRMIWGQGAVGLLQRSGQLESYKVEQIGPAPTSKQTTAQFSDDFGVRVTLKRRGQPTPYVGEYTVGKAKRAHLWMNTYKKPWIESPERQMQWRAFHIPATDGFSDILMGLSIREVAEDFEHEAPRHPGEDFFKEDTPAPYGPPINGALPPPTETPLTPGGAQASVEHAGDAVESAAALSNPESAPAPVASQEIRVTSLRPRPVVGEHAITHGGAHAGAAAGRDSNAAQDEGRDVSGVAPHELKADESALNPTPPLGVPNPGRAPAQEQRSGRGVAVQPALPVEVPVVADHGQGTAGAASVAEVDAAPTQPARGTLAPTARDEETFWTIAARSGNYELEISGSEKPPMTAGRLRFLASTAAQQSALSKFTAANLIAIEALPKTLRDGVESVIKRQMNKLTMAIIE